MKKSLKIILWVFISLTVFMLVGGAISLLKDNQTEATPAPEPTPEAAQQEGTTEGKREKVIVNGYYVDHGTILDADEYDDSFGKQLIVKAKIEMSLTNKLSIDQNYFNVYNLVKEQSAASFDTIKYWAVADTVDGDQVKVISFDVPKDAIEMLLNDSIEVSELGEYVDNLWIDNALES